MKPTTNYLYARKSSEDSSRQVQSIEDQVEDGLKRAERDGVRIPKSHILTEEMSAKAPGRPVFDQLIEIIQSHAHTTLYVWHWNRISRNPIDEGTLKWLLQRGKLTIVTPAQVFDQDTNMVVTSVEASQGNEWVIKLSKDVRRGLKGKWQKGIATSVPAGYIHVGERGNKQVVKDEERWPLLQRAFRLVLNGVAPMDALYTLNREWGFRTIKRKKCGGGPLTKTRWYELLRDPFFAGKFIQNGDEYEGNHEPMITEIEHWQIQELLGVKGRPRPQQDVTPAYLGLLACGECGGAITREVKKQVRCTCKNKYSALHRDTCPKCGLHSSKVPEKRKHEYEFYHCTKQKGRDSDRVNNGCTQGSISRKDLEAAILKMLDGITIPQAFVDWGLECLDGENDEELEKQKAILASLRKALVSKEEEIARHSRKYTKGLVDEDEEDEYLKEKNELRSERGELRKEVAKVEDAIDKWQDRIEETFNFARNAKETLENTKEPRTKTQVLAKLGANGKILDKELTLDIDPPFIAMEKMVQEMRAEFPSIEPAEIDEIVRDKGTSELVTSLRKSWLRRSDSNRRPTG